VSETPYDDSIKDIDQLEFLGTDRIGGRLCNKLRFIEKGDRVTMYIDQEQKLIRELLISPVKKDGGWDLAVTYQKADVNLPVNKGKFEVAKPSGAKQVERISFTRQFDYPREGNMIPDFEIDMLGAKRKASVKNFLGKKITFVTFWATWCPPCRAEMPILEELYKTYRDKGFEVVGVNLDTDGDINTITATVKELGVTFPILLDSRARYARELLVQNIPTLLVLDSSGKIMEAHVGTSADARKELGMIIEDAFASPKPGSLKAELPTGVSSQPAGK
jgi:thiol-disulfide isomerase/thioredoxin